MNGKEWRRWYIYFQCIEVIILRVLCFKYNAHLIENFVTRISEREPAFERLLIQLNSELSIYVFFETLSMLLTTVSFSRHERDKR